MADKSSAIANKKYGTAAPFLKTSFTLPDVDDGDTVIVPGLSRVKHCRVFATGATEDVVQAASISGRTVTLEGGTNTPVFIEALGYR